MKKKWWLISLPLIFLIILVTLAKTNMFKSFKTMETARSQQKVFHTHETANVQPDLTPIEPEIAKEPWPKPDAVKGVYTTGWIAGSDKWFPRLIKFINETEVNSLVVDVKDDTGTLSYESSIPLVKQINAFQKKIRDPKKVLEILRENKIFPIARIVVFKDPFMAKAKPEWAVKSSAGGLWTDRKGLHWVDPHNKQYWDYIVAISKEAIDLGFQEIQYDYVRFTSDGNVKSCIYPFSDDKSAEETIKDFLKYARAKLKPENIPIAADIFGLTTSADADLGIGQRFEKIAESVDIVCPMVYPSHYIPGNFGLKNPDLAPYETVVQSVRDAKKRLEESNNTHTRIRPWLQDFSLGSHYGRSQIQAQIRAVTDAGIKEWIFWNPSCRYDAGKYN